MPLDLDLPGPVEGGDANVRPADNQASARPYPDERMPSRTVQDPDAAARAALEAVPMVRQPQDIRPISQQPQLTRPVGYQPQEMRPAYQPQESRVTASYPPLDARQPVQQRAAAYSREAGYKFISVIWYGSRTLDWGKGSRLAQTLQTYAPTYVIVVLGSNELMARDVEQRALHVQSMLRTLGDLPVVWVGPPSWREDRGLNAMLPPDIPSFIAPAREETTTIRAPPALLSCGRSS